MNNIETLSAASKALRLYNLSKSVGRVLMEAQQEKPSYSELKEYSQWNLKGVRRETLRDGSPPPASRPGMTWSNLTSTTPAG